MTAFKAKIGEKSFDLEAQEDSPVATLKLALSLMCGLAPNCQKWIYQGRILTDEMHFKDTRVGADHTVIVMQVAAVSAASPSAAANAAVDASSGTASAAVSTSLFGTVKEISSLYEFNQALSLPGLLVVDFFTTWCAPCRAVAPFIEQLAKRWVHIQFIKVDIERHRDNIAACSTISSIPTFHFYIGGHLRDQLKGANKNQIEQKVLLWQQQAPDIRSLATGTSTTAFFGTPTMLLPTPHFDNAMMRLFQNSEEAVAGAVKVLLKLCINISTHPMEEKYRKINSKNTAFVRAVSSIQGGDMCMMALGFTLMNENWMLVPSAPAWENLMACKVKLERFNDKLASVTAPSGTTPATSPTKAKQANTEENNMGRTIDNVSPVVAASAASAAASAADSDANTTTTTTSTNPLSAGALPDVLDVNTVLQTLLLLSQQAGSSATVDTGVDTGAGAGVGSDGGSDGKAAGGTDMNGGDDQGTEVNMGSINNSNTNKNSDSGADDQEKK